MSRSSSKRSTALRWWAAFALFLAFLVIPGPLRSLFSGIPLATRAQLIFLLAIIAGVTMLSYPPHSRLRLRWFVIIAAAIALKVLLMTLWLPSGWSATYFGPKQWNDGANTLIHERQFDRGAIRSDRIDAAINFQKDNFGLFFVNNYPPDGARYAKGRRDVAYPLRVQWRGHVWTTAAAGAPLITASGSVTVSVDGHVVVRATNPRQAHIDATSLAAAGDHAIAIDYDKPEGVEPMIAVDGFAAPVTPDRATPNQIRTSNLAAAGITIVGLLLIGVMVLAAGEAYTRLSTVALEELWVSPSKVAAILLFTALAMIGFRHSVPNRHATIELSLGDDYLTYEGQSREILFNGPLMIDQFGHGAPYYHYPLYPYTLAVAHAVFGEDYGTIIFFNFLCIGTCGFFLRQMLKHRVTEGAVVAVIVFLGLLLVGLQALYCSTAYADNLYLPLVLATLASCVFAFERRSAGWMAASGILTALAAATRPSFMIFVPFFGLAILLDGRLGSLFARIRHGASFAAGFFAGVSPFTIRNWIVAHKFVLLVSSFIMLPYFLFAPEEPIPSFFVDGHPPGLLDSVRQFAGIWTQRPAHTLWVEVRKIGFTLGLTDLGPAPIARTRILIVLTLLFGLALWLRRIPWPIRPVLVMFALSHVTALVMGAPWTYGYKTILPLHAAFLAGIAFLLPSWGISREVESPVSAPEPGSRRRSVSVVLPTYNERDSIRQVILDFFATGVVDEIVVVNNNAAPGTSEEVAGTGAREVFEARQGYGSACRRGLAEATGDYIVICEPDGTFAARDIFKLLAYAEDFVVVYGSRTSQQLVWRGANMGVFLRWGNWAVAKYMEFLYNATSLTDVGCTMRLVHREAARSMLNDFRIDGSQFGPEMMIVSLRAGHRVIQVPVNYMPRVGVSSVTGDPRKAFVLGLQMIWLITSRRFEQALTTPPAPEPPVPRREPRHGNA